MISIRSTGNAQLEAVCAVHANAFGEPEGPEIVRLVRDLFHDATALPLLSLAAEEEGRIVGHVLFTRVAVAGSGEAFDAQILAPLAVAPGHQGTGVGGLLIRAGLERLAVAGTALVFVLGYPEYYRRFGFHPATSHGLNAPYPIPEEHEDAWMVQALRPGILDRVRGTVQCADALDRPQYW